MGKGARSREQRAAVEALAPKSKKHKGHTVRNIALGVAGTLVAVALVFGILFGNGVLQRSFTAMQVGEQKISAMEYGYYYSQVRNSFVNNYGEALSQSGIDMTTIDSQAYSEDMTFGEYFKQSTATQLTNMYSIYNEAKAANYELSAEGKEKLQASLDSLTAAAEEQKTTPEKLLRNTVSAPISIKDYNQILERSFYANTFYSENVQTEDFPDAEINAYYSENPDQFDTVDYRIQQFFFEAGADEAEKTANKEKAKALADEMLSKITTEASFASLAKTYAEPDATEDSTDPTLKSGTGLATASGTVADWYKDPARKAGDKAVLEIDTNYSVIYFVNRHLDQTPTIDVRHILVKPVDGNDADAKTKADTLLGAFNAGDKTEEAFAELATANTEDPGSSETGGLYENVTKGMMMADFDAWCFDATRKQGDTGIVKTDAGYHVMYFVKTGDLAWKVTAQSALADTEYTQYIESATSKYDITSSNFAINMVI